MKYRLVSWILTACIGVAGCTELSKPRVKIDRYIFEYPAPVAQGQKRLNIVIKIRRFSSSAAYNHDRIVYKEDDFRRQLYNYHRWMVNPADMITDFLTRDFRASSLYKGVLRYESKEWPDYEIEGAVSEIYEEDGEDQWFALLAVSASLLKTREADITKRLLFQKDYRFKERCVRKSPRGVVEAMSRAMSKFSKALQEDVYRALSRNRMVLKGG